MRCQRRCASEGGTPTDPSGRRCCCCCCPHTLRGAHVLLPKFNLMCCWLEMCWERHLPSSPPSNRVTNHPVWPLGHNKHTRALLVAPAGRPENTYVHTPTYTYTNTPIYSMFIHTRILYTYIIYIHMHICMQPIYIYIGYTRYMCIYTHTRSNAEQGEATAALHVTWCIARIYTCDHAIFYMPRDGRKLGAFMLTPCKP